MNTVPGTTDAFRRILPFLRELEPYILDPDISEIMVNSPTEVFIEKKGLITQLADIRLQPERLLVAVQNIARSLGDDISEEKPILDARLPDGSRIAAILPPCSIKGITLTIRKFNSHQFTIDDLLRLGTITQDVCNILQGAVAKRQNVLLSGGTGTGKTTILNILTDSIPDERRILVIEDTAEIHIRKPDVVRFEGRRQQGAKIPAITIRDLLRASLRHRPDTIILGEIRGPEAFDFLQALNTGHSGSLSTIHANSALETLSRLESCFLMSGIDMPFKAIQANIASSIDLIVYIERHQGHRRVTEIMELESYSPEQQQYKVNPLFTREIGDTIQ